ncbi:MAG TPA: type VI secretion system tip protein TssI/VgrG [Terriglobia bacterium]|nr:type VI secretion system tip protein TssI/VgrG [Terriglobia bacterium]
MGESESYTQATRLLSISTPLGEDVLLLQGLAGQEGISRPFTYELELLAPTNSAIAFNSIVGQNVTVTIQLPDGSPRYINGYVSRFAQGATDERYFTRYHAQVVPWLWFLTRHADCRIFQNMTAPDIISQVFQLFDFASFKNKTTATYPNLEYCVQYRETAFNFVSRLMEQFGIFYYFDHSTQGQHTLVMCDSNNGLPVCAGSPLSYQTEVGGLEDPEVVSDWHLEQELETGKYSVTDYDFTAPSNNLLAQNPTVVSVSPNQGLEIFDYPGLHIHTEPGDEVPKLHLEEGNTVAKTRMEEEEAHAVVSTGASNCRGLASGYTFELQNHYRSDQNAKYLLTEVQQVASEGNTYATGTRETESYSNRFTCIPTATPYRPNRVTRKPFVQGPQPALVVGKSGEEIWTDNYGRVKVQFYWDRIGTQDENSSCWVRVSHPWAGSGWGAVALPRMGQEVIVDFLEGDPDRPIIMGRVYNANQMPPYALPDMQTRSTVQSRSSKGGGTANYNEIRFEDKAGSEQVFLNAEKEMDLRVEKESREYVGANRHLIVNSSQFELVNTDKHLHIKGKQNEKIESDQSLTVGGNCMESISANQSVKIGANRKVSIGGSDSRTVTGDVKEQVTGSVSLTVSGDQKETVLGDVSRQVVGGIKEQAVSGFSQFVAESTNVQNGMSYNLTAGMTINLSGGMAVNIMGGAEGVSIVGPGGFISITEAGIAIMGTMVLINSGGAPGEATPASPEAPDSPDQPDSPDAPTAPTDPDTADDGSKGTKLS